MNLILTRFYTILYVLLIGFCPSALHGQISCCCGTVTEMDFPGLDFELDPQPAPAGYNWYIAVTNLGPWVVAKGIIDHGDKDYCGGLANGNPNGPSTFVDLYGSTPSFNTAGTLEYLLTGLTVGYTYTIEFWYATFTANGNFSANLKVANGAWLNVNWTANNPGSVVWLKKSYSFVALSASTFMAFTDTGASSPSFNIGMLLDDIKIFECPSDLEKPKVFNAPQDISVECDAEIPVVEPLEIQDNCDPSTNIVFKENKIITDPCHKTITRDWAITDDCANTLRIIQNINVFDDNPPQIINLPKDKIVYCGDDVLKAFNEWFNSNANALFMDFCDSITLKINYTRLPKNSCDTVTLEIIAADVCGNEITEKANFIVQDTSILRFEEKPRNIQLTCSKYSRDSLRHWLSEYAFAKPQSNCDSSFLSHNFDGDSTKNPIKLTVYVKNQCGQIDSSTAEFMIQNMDDTFRISTYSCQFAENTIDTIRHSTQGCDSIVIHSKIKRLGDSLFLTDFTCDPNQKLFDTVHLVNQWSCDSLIFFSYDLKSTPIQKFQQFDCGLQVAYIDSVIFKGQYCDSIIIIEHIPVSGDTMFLQKFTCDSMEQGLTQISLKNSYGCDSIVFIQTLFTKEKTTGLVSYECNIVLEYWDTIRYTTFSCDSFVITQHIPVRSDTVNITSQTCDAKASGKFTTIYKNSLGCDSLVMEEIILQPSDSIYLVSGSCDISNSGLFKRRLKNQFGCDSIIVEEVIYHPPDTNSISTTTCLSFEAGADTLYYKNRLGCDSLVIEQTIFLPADTSFITQHTCSPNLVTRDTLHFLSSSGCDSLVYLEILFQPTTLSVRIDSILCSGTNTGSAYVADSSLFSNLAEVYINGQAKFHSFTFDQLGPGIYKMWVVDQNFCLSDTFLFELMDPPALKVDLGKDIEVPRGNPVVIDLVSNKTLQRIIWSTPQVISCDNCQRIEIVVNETSWIYTQGIDEKGCSATDSLLITVIEDISFYAPNSFSPNHDEINDWFYILGNEKAVVKSLQIFDRWGQLVFEAKNAPVNIPEKGWNGLFKGRDVNPAVFVYTAIIVLDNKEYFLKGDMLLLR